MMRTVKAKHAFLILLAVAISVVWMVDLHAETLNTRIGRLEFTHDFTNGYPTNATVKKLFEEIDFQRACQAYIWSIMAMLKPLGIEKGKPFQPNWRQERILVEAALVGEAMAKANDFLNPRLEDAHYLDGSHREFTTTSPPDQRREHYDALDDRAAWLYEAVTNDLSMHGQKTGKGQIYMAAYKDREGDWLDGGKNYTLHVPPDIEKVDRFKIRD